MIRIKTNWNYVFVWFTFIHFLGQDGRATVIYYYCFGLSFFCLSFFFFGEMTTSNASRHLHATTRARRDTEEDVMG